MKTPSGMSQTNSPIETDEQLAQNAKNLCLELLRYVNEVLRPRGIGVQFSWGKNPDGSDNLARFDVFKYIRTDPPPPPPKVN